MTEWAAESWSVLWLSLPVSGAAVVLSTLGGVPLGCWLGLTRSRLGGLLRVLIYTGMGLPPVVVGLALYLMLSRSGPLAFLGWLFTPQATVVAQTMPGYGPWK